MTILSDEVKDFLDTIYFYEIAHNAYPVYNLTPVYNLFLEKLSSIESFPQKKHKRSRTFPFSRDNMFGVIFGRYEFGYYYDGSSVYISGYRRKGNRTNDWLDSIIKESVRHITQSQLRRIVKSVVREVLETHRRQILNEKFYNPVTEPMIDRKLGNYEVLEGSWTEQILCDIPQKGWIQNICMYSSADITYELYRRCDNGKYFFTKKVILPDDEYVHTIPISYKTVPSIILNDARNLIRNN